MKSYKDDLLERQQISKRKHSGSPAERSGGFFPSGNTGRRKSTGEPAYRPAGVISRFEKNTRSRLIDSMRQKTARDSARGPSRHETVSSRKTSIFQEFFGEREEAAPESRQRNSRVRENRPRERSRGKEPISFLSMPAIPFAALVILAIGVLFVIYNQAGAFDWTGREVVNTEKDRGSQYNLALYAGVNQEKEAPESGETIPLDLMETFAWQAYKVKRGDSVSKIAAAYSVSMDAIIASNAITNARALRVGEELRIPNMDGIPYTVKNGDSLSGISRKMGVPLEAILDANDIQNDAISAGSNLFIPGARMNRDDLKMALGELFIYPVRGARLSSPFGWRNDPISGVRRHHAAIDLSAPQGTPIKAAMDGKVSSQGYNGTYGNFVIINHSGGYQTMYAHLHTTLVKKGEQVRQGSQIGTVGNTGYSTGPHLHFSVFKNNRAVNPLDYLNPRS